MAINLSDYLVIGISSRALFDLDKENEIFETEGVEAYSKYQLENEEEVLPIGVGFRLIKSILKLNEITDGERKVEVIIMSRNNPDTSLRIFKSIEHYGLDITRAALTSGSSIVPYLDAFKIDLFLSANDDDVQAAIDSGIAAGKIYGSEQSATVETLDEIKIAFDGDAVIFSDESEKIYQAQGLEAFLAHEKANRKKPLEAGPFAKLLSTIATLQRELGKDNPIKTALVTARNSPAHERVIRTFREWGVRMDKAFFLGGVPKQDVLKAFEADIFFDDQDIHLSGDVPSAKVPYIKR